MAINNAKVLSDIKKWQKDIEEAIELKVQEVAVEIVESFVKYSTYGQPEKWIAYEAPFDYIPGKYISNWQAGVNEVPEMEVESYGPSGNISIESVTSDVQRYKIGDSIAIVNTADYATVLEETGFTYLWIERNQDGVLQPTINDISTKNDWIVPTS